MRDEQSFTHIFSPLILKPNMIKDRADILVILLTWVKETFLDLNNSILSFFSTKSGKTQSFGINTYNTKKEPNYIRSYIMIQIETQKK